MKKKLETCHALVFAKQLCNDGKVPWMQDLKVCEEAVIKSFLKLKKTCGIQTIGEARHIAHVAYTVSAWMKSMQSYSISKELAADLFSMDDLSFPISELHLPFPVIYLDLEPLQEPFAGQGRGRLLGLYIMVDEVPYGENMFVSFCSIVVLGLDSSNNYFYGGVAFDYYPAHMEKSLEETLEMQTKNLPEQKKYLQWALLFAAYLSSKEPEIVENENQKRIFHPSEKPKYSAVRKWDVGVRYMKERQNLYHQRETGNKETGKRNSPRPHMRKAHWHTYRIGPGKKERMVRWIPPVTVGLEKGRNEELPVTIRKKE